MAGIFNGLGDLFTGGGGADLSKIPPGQRDALISRQIDSLNYATNIGMEANMNQRAQLQSQKNLLPFIYNQLGFDANFGAGGELEGFNYRGTDAQRGMDQMARLGQDSLAAQYANAGYHYAVDPTGRSYVEELPNSQRNLFLSEQDRQIQQAQGLRDRAYGDLLGNQQRGDTLYHEAYGNLQGNIGQQREAIDATRRQLQTAEAYQPAALESLGYTRDLYGQITKAGDTRMGQYETELYNQMRSARGLQGASLAQMGYVPDGQGGFRFDPNSYAGQIQASYQNQMGQAGRESATAEQLRNAELGRLGMMQQDGQWVNDPNSNEMRMRGLQGEYLSRTQRAMAGELGISPGLQRQLQDEELQLRNQLIQNLGPGYMTTSPGMEALANFQKRKSELYYNEQQDLLGSSLQGALGLQGSNLNTLAALYASGDPVLRAYANQLNVSNSASQAANQTNATNAQVMGQLQQNVLNPITAAGNLNAQNLAGLYGLTGAAQSAANQLGTLTNQNIGVNQAAYGNLNNMGIANQDALMRAYGTVGQLGGQTQNAINNRASGAINFQNANAAVLGMIPQQQQQLYSNANMGRLASLSALYPALQSGYDNSGAVDIAKLFTAMGGNPGATALGINEQIQNAQQVNDATNMNNMFWRNMAASAGKSIGSMAGGMGGAAGGMVA